MIVNKDIKQGSPEWFYSRCGIPTASNFDKIVTTDRDSIVGEAKESFKKLSGIDRLSKKEDKEKFDSFLTDWLKKHKCARSKQSEKYMYQLAGERITGIKEEGFSSKAMQEGIEKENEARLYFEMYSGVEVEQVGFCTTDDGKVGCSPDGLVGVNAGLEIKCPLLHTHISYKLNGGLLEDYFQQVQGSMLVTGFYEWWLMSYYPNIDPVIIHVERDERFIAELAQELVLFLHELDKITEKLR